MQQLDFQRRLRDKFDDRIRVVRDPRDHCWIVLDRTRSGVPYPAYKVCCELHGNPSQLGTPRDPSDIDINALDYMNWAERYAGRQGAAGELMSRYYSDPYANNRLKANRAVEELCAPGGRIHDLAMWKCGVRNSVPVRPHSPNIPTGDRRRRV